MYKSPDYLLIFSLLLSAGISFAQTKPVVSNPEKIMFLDDFSKDALADFPVKWNTNGSGAIVKIENHKGLWLRIPDNTITYPELKIVLPQNFIIEFDLYYPKGTTRPPITFGFTEVKNPAKESLRYKKLFYFRIPQSGPENIGYSTSIYSGREITQSWPSHQNAGKSIHVNIQVHAQRIRLYLDGEKMFDLPKAFEHEILRNSFYFRAADVIPSPKDGFYVSNISMRGTGSDARSQLLKEGKFVTSGIYFNSGSAEILPASFAVLNELGEALTDNTDLHILITGHTDNEGAAASNLSLSEQRANAVKGYFTKKYQLNASRFSVAGKGQQSPIADNTTAEGRAQNRRVEFVVVRQ